MGTMAANWNGDFGTSPFFVGSSSDKSVLASINGRAGDKEQGVTRGPRTRIFAVGDGPSILASPIRQRTGNFVKSDTSEILRANTRVISKAFRQIPYATEQGIISAEQGILAGTGNFPHVIDQKPIRIKGLEPPTRPL